MVKANSKFDEAGLWYSMKQREIKEEHREGQMFPVGEVIACRYTYSLLFRNPALNVGGFCLVGVLLLT